MRTDGDLCWSVVTGRVTSFGAISKDDDEDFLADAFPDASKLFPFAEFEVKLSSSSSLLSSDDDDDDESKGLFLLVVFVLDRTG